MPVHRTRVTAVPSAPAAAAAFADATTQQLSTLLRHAAVHTPSQPSPRSVVNAGRILTQQAPRIAAATVSRLNAKAAALPLDALSEASLLQAVMRLLWRTYAAHDKRTCTFRFTGTVCHVSRALQRFLSTYGLQHGVHVKVKRRQASPADPSAVEMDVKVSFGTQAPPGDVPSFASFFASLRGVTVRPRPAGSPLHGMESIMMADIVASLEALLSSLQRNQGQPKPVPLCI